MAKKQLNWRQKFQRLGLPEAACMEFEMYSNENTTVEICPDPKVNSAFAVRVTRLEGKKLKPFVFDLLWNRGGFDEVDFETWPPVSGDLKFSFNI